MIQALVSCARQKGEEAIAVTFAQHPRAVLQQDARTLRLLNSPQEKEALLRSLGVDRVETLPFDRAFASLTASEYISDVLIGRFDADTLVLGYDNRLGSDCLTPDRIRPLAEGLGLEVVIVPAATATTGVTVSSTKIRESLEQGRVEAAEEMLGYAYRLRGVVVGGKQLGRKLGFPTANLRLYDPLKLVPARGVYLTEVEVLGRPYWGMTNVGDIIETHIFDFDEDIYGLDLEIRFRRRLREMRPFDSLDALKAQLAADKAACLALIAAGGPAPAQSFPA